MNILHIIPYYIRATGTGGPAIQLDHLAHGLVYSGSNVRIVTSTGNMVKDIDLPFSGLQYNTLENDISVTYLHRSNSVLPRTFYYAPVMTNWLNNHLGEYDITIIHGMWTYFSWLGSIICQKHKKPYLVFIHGSLDPWALKHHGLKKMPYWLLIEKPNLKKASGIVVLSKDEAHQVKAMGIDTPTFLARNGLVFPLLKVDTPRTIITQHLPEIGENPFVCFISRLHSKKGLDILIGAWKDIVSRYPQWRLIIAGPDEGGYLGKLREMVKTNGLEESIFFPGLVQGDIKAALFQEASIFTLPSYSEGVPGAVVEALAYGKPVVITPGCHMPEVAENNAGLIVEPEAKTLAKALDHLIVDKGLRDQMGHNAEMLARDQYDELKVAEGLVDFCQNILTEKKRVA